MALMGMGITDVVIAGHAGATELAGMSLGNNVANIIMYFFFGIGLAAHPLVGHCFGEGSIVNLRRQIHQVIWAAIFCGALCAILIFSASLLLMTLDFEVNMRAIGSRYMMVMTIGALVFPLLTTLRASIEAMGQTRVVFGVNIVAFVLNIPLDYALVYGVWGFPQLGGVGCALATVCLHWMMMFSFGSILIWGRKNRSLKLLRKFSMPIISEIIKIFKLGIPLAMSVLMEIGFFGLAGIMIAYFGEVAAGAHVIAMTVAGLCYMIYLGLGQAITIRTSQLLGAKHYQSAWNNCRLGLGLGLLSTIPPILIILFFSDAISRLFSSDAEVIALATSLLFWAALFQLGDALQITALCGLRAYKETLSPLRLQLIGFWIVAFPLGYSLHQWGWLAFASGPSAYWLAMIVGLSLTGLLLLIKLMKVGKKQLQESAVQHG